MIMDVLISTPQFSFSDKWAYEIQIEIQSVMNKVLDQNLVQVQVAFK